MTYNVEENSVKCWRTWLNSPRVYPWRLIQYRTNSAFLSNNFRYTFQPILTIQEDLWHTPIRFWTVQLIQVGCVLMSQLQLYLVYPMIQTKLIRTKLRLSPLMNFMKLNLWNSHSRLIIPFGKFYYSYYPM